MKVFGIISDERALRSKSPAMHNPVLRQQGIDAVYVPFVVAPERVAEAVAGLRALNIAGANVTVPYKEKVMPSLDELTSEARGVGAVNTIVNREGTLIGRNTDAEGFLAALDGAGLDPAGARAWIFGAGGAAKAAAYALVRAGADRVTMAGRDLTRTAAAAGHTGAVPTTLTACDCAPLRADLVVNATSVSDPAEAPELAERIARLKLDGCRMVFDVNYGRNDNFWRDLADANGALFEDGLFMLAHQARLSFFHWTGLDLPAGDFAAGLRNVS